MKPDDEARLAEIAARAEAATAGPWTVCPHEGGMKRLYLEGVDIDLDYDDVDHDQQDANAHFIAAAREDVEWLIGLVRAQAAAHEDLLAKAMDANAKATKLELALRRATDYQRLADAMVTWAQANDLLLDEEPADLAQLRSGFAGALKAAVEDATWPP